IGMPLRLFPRHYRDAFYLADVVFLFQEKRLSLEILLASSYSRDSWLASQTLNLTELFIVRANHCIFVCLLSGRELEVICIVNHNHKGGNMARIVHLALKVDDLENSSDFYEEILGFV